MLEVIPSQWLLVRKENDSIGRAGGTGSRGFWGKKEHLVKNCRGRFIWLSEKLNRACELVDLRRWDDWCENH